MSRHPKELIIGDVSKGILTRSNLEHGCATYAFISSIEPKNVDEACNDEFWMFAIQEELNQFKKNNVWKLVSKSLDHPVIKTKWIFRNK